MADFEETLKALTAYAIHLATVQPGSKLEETASTAVVELAFHATGYALVDDDPVWGMGASSADVLQRTCDKALAIWNGCYALGGSALRRS